MNKRRWFSVVLSFLITFSTFFSGMVSTAFAEGTPREVTATIKKLEIKNLAGQNTDKVFVTDKFYLDMEWDASSNGANMKKGDYFDITLPNNMKFPSDSSARDFDIYGDDGKTVIAKAHVTPGADDNGGKVRVTFTDWVNGKQNVKGKIRLASMFNKEAVTKNKKNTFNVTVSGKVVPVSVEVVGPKDLPSDEILAKWGQSGSNANEAEWWVRVNYQKAKLNNATISDHLTGGTGSETYIPGSFKLVHVEYTSLGDHKQIYKYVDLSDKLKIAPDGKSFTIKLGKVNGEQYRLIYRTTYKPGTKLVNNVKISSDEKSMTVRAAHISADSGGSGTGDLANKIKLTKVDAENKSTTLADAVFEVTRPDGSKFDLTTGSDGTVTSGFLTSGTYKVREKKAPSGYELNGEEYTLKVDSSGGTLRTIEDKPIKTYVKVNKKWIGKAADSVRVHLYADDVDTGKSTTLNAGNNWTYTFEGLRKYTPKGKAIKYTVKEDVPSGYKSKVTGGQECAYTITNTNIEKTKIPVEKTWVGKKLDKVEVKLLADNKATDKVLTLNEASNWKGEFKDLPKYDETDGHEIVYTIKEDTIENYKSEITGDAASGFKIKNTNTEKVNVPVKKQWVGKATDKVEVKLLADNKETDKTLTLNKASDWKGEFKDLPKYDETDGHEIVYTIKEVKIEGYNSATSGTAQNGFTITNTITGKVSIPVTKKWVGAPADSITVNLYADGKKVASRKISKDDNWQYTFKNLEQYNNGKEIKYTVEEEKIPGYKTNITGDSKVGYTITNTKDMPKNPKTGDSNKIFLFGGVMLASLLALILLIVRRRKAKISR